MIYLSGCHSEQLAGIAGIYPVGLMLNVRAVCEEHIPRYPFFAVDNDCYNQGSAFDPEHWLWWIDTAIHSWERCLFVVLPDVVADADATRARADLFLPMLKDRQLPIAYVSQNGATEDTVPWHDIDWLFTGGDDEWKLSVPAARLSLIAREKGLRTHIGRVNSRKRTVFASQIGCTSVDGTFLRFRPWGIHEIAGWIETAEAYKPHGLSMETILQWVDDFR